MYICFNSCSMIHICHIYSDTYQGHIYVPVHMYIVVVLQLNLSYFQLSFGLNRLWSYDGNPISKSINLKRCSSCLFFFLSPYHWLHSKTHFSPLISQHSTLYWLKMTHWERVTCANVLFYPATASCIYQIKVAQ